MIYIFIVYIGRLIYLERILDIANGDTKKGLSFRIISWDGSNGYSPGLGICIKMFKDGRRFFVRAYGVAQCSPNGVYYDRNKKTLSSFRMPQYDPELPNRYAYYYFRQGGKAPECVSSRSLEGVYGQLTSGGNGDQSGDYKDKQSWIIEPVPYVLQICMRISWNEYTHIARV